MIRPGWYLVVYDIANSNRLKKVHRVLKNNGIPIQKSVFFVNGNETEISNIMDIIAGKMILTEDDLRAYPIISPENVWTNGTNPLALCPIADSKPLKTKLKHKIKNEIIRISTMLSKIYQRNKDKIYWKSTRINWDRKHDLII